MKRIYTSIDIGSDSIKVVVGEIIAKRLHILASTCVRSVGISKGLIVDQSMVAKSINLAIREIESMLGVKIDKAIITVPSNNRELKIVSSQVKVESSDWEVSSNDIVKSLKKALDNKIEKERELVTIIPIGFSLDNKEGIKEPLGLIGKKLGVKAIISTVPKRNVYSVLNVLKECNIEVVDLALSPVGDYYMAKNKDLDSKLGAIVNIGSETTNISIFNKGIMIKNSILDIGAKDIDNDIAFVYKVDRSTARYLKEKFSVSSKKYADTNDNYEIKTKNEEKLIITQYEISEIVEKRLIEILKIIDKEIRLLTKREINYIIVTGGISELAGFGYIVDNVLGHKATPLNITTIGIRNNKFSTSAGLIRHFSDKLLLRGKEYSMFDEKNEQELIATKKKIMNISNDTILSKVFGYFFDN
ncbi:MAG: cell division protein FtsA [Tenericutes bacterium]|jgi:cell division protein FtsA|nr:cell division protein FtsA [Mycoplasmatota bacterium]